MKFKQQPLVLNWVSNLFLLRHSSIFYTIGCSLTFSITCSCKKVNSTRRRDITIGSSSTFSLWISFEDKKNINNATISWSIYIEFCEFKVLMMISTFWYPTRNSLGNFLNVRFLLRINVRCSSRCIKKFNIKIPRGVSRFYNF